MNEITRVHIAKVPYDIEILAKKELEKYLSRLTTYAEEPDWLGDIEIRMTEILGERGVSRDGVISSEDVVAIKDQLGEPKDFLGDGDIAIGTEIEDTNKRRLYRDIDTAILGGVLSGIAKFFGISPIWTRLVFVILLLISFGTAFIVYLILWLVVPPARSAAEKLQLEGQTVTLASIKMLREQEEADPYINRTPIIVQNILLYGASTLSAIAALGALGAVIVADISLYITKADILQGFISNSTWSWIAIGLFNVAGLALSAFSLVVAWAFFKKTLTKKIGISIVAIAIGGIIAFGLGVSTVWYNSWQENQRAIDSRYTRSTNLPAEFSSIKSLTLDTTDDDGSLYGEIKYVVSHKKPYYTIELDSRTNQMPLKTTFDNKKGSVTIKITKNKIHNFAYYEPLITIYGPALETVNLKSNTNLDYTDNSGMKPTIKINSEVDSNMSLLGTYGTVIASTKYGANLTLSEATIETLQASLNGGYITTGVIKNLTVIQPDVCPAHNSYSDSNRLVVQAISSNELTLNGRLQSAQTITQNCGEIIVGDESEYETKHLDQINY